MAPGPITHRRQELCAQGLLLPGAEAGLKGQGLENGPHSLLGIDIATVPKLLHVHP